MRAHASKLKSDPVLWKKCYGAWIDMKKRCRQANTNPKYRWYKGITVCTRWQNSFENFFDDVGLPTRGQSLDRINCKGNYEPSNVRWASSKIQGQNRDYVRLSEDSAKMIRKGIAVGFTRQQMARAFSVSWTTVDKVYQGLTW